MTTCFLPGAAGLALLAATIGAGPAIAGPCGRAVAQFEAFTRLSRAHPSARQSVAAQLDRQPTPASVKHAQLKAGAAFRSMMARAKALDAAGREAECRQVLTDARLVFGLQ